MPLQPGSRLGPYEIVAPLGAGGMGEVYRARDARLSRDVAIKVLPDALAHDPERLVRFEREARLLAAMSHAGIAAIFGLEDAGGRPALVMEVVEGPTLAERLERGALPEDEVLALARQLADALEYAHDKGIVHRDLKPANVKLRPDGTLKVLDFGLARALDDSPAGSASDMTRSPTITQRMTAAGAVLGTAAYMAPEQARGREADRRADVWAFGAVLFEMLTGRRAFSGETVSDTLAAVMRDEPDWSALPVGLAPFWRPLLARCLAKDPRERLQAIGEARIALANPAASGAFVAGAAPGASAGRASRRPAWTVPALAVALVLALGAVALLALRHPPAVPAATELGMALAPGEQFAEDRGYGFFTISPDGRAIAHVVRTGGSARLRLRRLDRREETEFPGIEAARNPFFSPDGQWIGFFNGFKMCKVSTSGGQPVELADAGQDRLGAWLDDGTIVYSPEATSGLMRMPGAGGPATAVTVVDTAKHERTHRFPCALAGGPWVVFTVGRVESPGGYDDSPIDAVNVRTGERRHLVDGARCAKWAPPGYLVFDRAGDLYAMPIDPRDPRPTREPLVVVHGVAGETSSGQAHFALTADGTLAWVAADPHANEREVGWFDRKGAWSPVPLPTGPYLKLSVSEDGTRALVTQGPGGGASDLWLVDLVHGGLNRLTYGLSANPGLFLPGGDRIVYPRRVSHADSTLVVVRRVDGAGGERVIYGVSTPAFVSSITPGGRGVVVNDYGLSQGRMRIAAIDGAPSVQELAADDGAGFAEQAGMVSPDGRWLAYVSNRTRREEVFVRSLSGSGGRWQVSTGGGGGPHWGRDSRELFYVSRPAESMMRVTLTPNGDDLAVGRPEPLFDMGPTPFEPTYREFDYDRAHDRFLVMRPPGSAGGYREIALSLAWTRRLPALLREKKGGS